MKNRDKTKLETRKFKREVRSYYKKYGRALPWRNTKNPYRILVSEVMLQQTQVKRVLPKYKEFIREFPTIKKLAYAQQSDVLRVWSGLGYNRRALYLHAIAKEVCKKYNGKLPLHIEKLESFKGVGENTAAAIYCFATNKPTVFIETNIRSVFIHFFFSKKRSVHDADILPLIEKTLNTKNPQEWYYALMDYGVYLKSQYKNPSQKSVHHTVQSKFKGSRRELRGALVKLLLQKKKLKEKDLPKLLSRNMKDIHGVLTQLEQDGFLKRKGEIIILL